MPGASFSLRRMLRERALWILAACTVAFFYRPLFGETFFFRDLYLLFYGKRILFAEALRHGEIPLWDPLMHGGQPFLASPGNSALYPFNILFLILPSLTALNLHLVLQFVFCGISAYFLARVLGLSETAAFVSGAVYTFCGYILSSATLLVLMQAVPWAPALLASVHLLLREGRKRWLVAAAIFGTLPLLGGGAEMSATSFALAVAWALFVPRDLPIAWRAKIAALVVAFSVGLSLMQTLPAYEVIRNSSRGAKRDYAAFVQWSVSPQRLPELVVPQFFGPTDTLARSDYWGGRYEVGYPYIVSIYFGASVLLLAVGGALGSSLAGRFLLATFAAAGLVMCLGGYLPFFHFLYEHVPLIGVFRFPVKALQFSLVPIAVLSGAGLDALTTSRRKMLVPAIVTAMLLLILAHLLHGSRDFRSIFSAAMFGGELQAQSAAALCRSVLQAAIAMVLFVLALLVNRPFAIAALVFIDLALAGWRVNPYASRELFVEPPLAAKVKSILDDGGKLYRTPDPFVQRLNVPTNENVWLAWWDIQLLSRYTAATWGIPLVFHEDYDGLAPIQMSRATAGIAAMPWPRRLDMLSAAGATAIITPDVIASPNVERVETLRGANGLPLFLYRNRASRPLDFRMQGESRGARVQTIARSLNRWSVSVDAPSAGILVFAETWYPGMRMSVDGAERPQLRADFGLSAALVPAGHHVVTKAYRPQLPLIGLLGSLATAVGLAFLRLKQ